MELVHLDKIRKQYDETEVLHITELRIHMGECIGLVGNNGAGKTTLFHILLDLIPATSGLVYLKGAVAAGTDHWKSWTSAFIDESFLIGYLRAEEYFYLVGEMRGVAPATVDVVLEQYQEFFDGEILNKRTYIRDLSKGNQKKVGLIATLLGDPEFIIWDEPFANLDPSSQIRLKHVITDIMRDRNRTLLISSHDLSHTVDVCNRIIVLKKGSVIMDESTSAETLPVLEAYFTT